MARLQDTPATRATPCYTTTVAATDQLGSVEVANHGCSDQPYGGLTESEFGAVFHRAETLGGEF